MITRVHIRDAANSPLKYLTWIETKVPMEASFNPGLNILIGRNGSGKTTLLNAIRWYTMCKDQFMSNCPNDLLGLSNDMIDWNFTIGGKEKQPDTLRDGVDVYGDYNRAVFNMRTSDMIGRNVEASIENFEQTYTSMHVSAGQRMIGTINKLFDNIRDNAKAVAFPIQDFKDRIPTVNSVYADRLQLFLDYFAVHTVQCEDQITVLMDEPDQGLDVINLKGVYELLKNNAPKIQLIAAIHNPILIYKLYRQSIHPTFIECTPGYLKAILDFMEDTDEALNS